MDVIDVCLRIRQTADANMANGIATELRARGYEPEEFTILAYGGNGPLHCCGVANALGADKVLSPPFSPVFSALGAGNVNQMHIHELSTYTVLFHTGTATVLTEYERLNTAIEELEERGRRDLLRQGMDPLAIKFRLEFDMRYGNQRVETAVATDVKRFESVRDVLELINRFHTRYGERFGEGSQSSESGVRINTVRVSSYIELDKVDFTGIKPLAARNPVAPVGTRQCRFVGFAQALETSVYDDTALHPGSFIEGPAVVTTADTTYLVEPGWTYHASNRGAVWFFKA
jgi:N-methylhydantoinase A